MLSKFTDAPSSGRQVKTFVYQVYGVFFFYRMTLHNASVPSEDVQRCGAAGVLKRTTGMKIKTSPGISPNLSSASSETSTIIVLLSQDQNIVFNPGL